MSEFTKTQLTWLGTCRVSDPFSEWLAQRIYYLKQTLMTDWQTDNQTYLVDSSVTVVFLTFPWFPWRVVLLKQQDLHFLDALDKTKSKKMCNESQTRPGVYSWKNSKIDLKNQSPQNSAAVYFQSHQNHLTSSPWSFKNSIKIVV